MTPAEFAALEADVRREIEAIERRRAAGARLGHPRRPGDDELFLRLAEAWRAEKERGAGLEGERDAANAAKALAYDDCAGALVEHNEMVAEAESLAERLEAALRGLYGIVVHVESEYGDDGWRWCDVRDALKKADGALPKANQPDGGDQAAAGAETLPPTPPGPVTARPGAMGQEAEDSRDEAWLLARARGEDAAHPDPARAEGYVRLEGALGELPVRSAPSVWEERVTAAIDADEKKGPP